MLAQRLDELATANAEGLLEWVLLLIYAYLDLDRHAYSDEEYRLLRQNLFERMAGGSPLPTEVSLVPIAGPSCNLEPKRKALWVIYLEIFMLIGAYIQSEVDLLLPLSATSLDPRRCSPESLYLREYLDLFVVPPGADLHRPHVVMHPATPPVSTP